MTATGNLVFADTNVLLYLLDSTDRQKQAAAREWIDALWASGRGRLSWQVLNEYYENAVRKLRAPAKMVRSTVEGYAEWGPAEWSVGLLRRGWHWTDHAGISYWDSLIVAAAEASGCHYLLSEDLQEGRTFGSVQVISPFQTGPAAILQR